MIVIATHVVIHVAHALFVDTSCTRHRPSVRHYTTHATETTRHTCWNLTLEVRDGKGESMAATATHPPNVAKAPQADATARAIACTTNRLPHPAGCFAIKDTASCCEYFDPRAHYADAPLCASAKTTFSNGNACEPEGWVQSQGEQSRVQACAEPAAPNWSCAGNVLRDTQCGHQGNNRDSQTADRLSKYLVTHGWKPAANPSSHNPSCLRDDGTDMCNQVSCDNPGAPYLNRMRFANKGECSSALAVLTIQAGNAGNAAKTWVLLRMPPPVCMCVRPRMFEELLPAARYGCFFFFMISHVGRWLPSPRMRLACQLIAAPPFATPRSATRVHVSERATGSWHVVRHL